jgi:hypothetical protein
MAKETLLVSTKDNGVVCFNLEYDNEAVKKRKTLQYKAFCERLTGEEFSELLVKFSSNGDKRYKDVLQDVDIDNQNMLQEYLTPYTFIKQPQNFKNDMVTNNNCPSDIKNAENSIHFDYRISDDFFPEMMKKLGIQVCPKDQIFDIVNTNNNGYEIKDLDITRATVCTSGRKLIIYRKHFKVQSKKEYLQLQRMINQFETMRRGNPNLSELEYANQYISDAKQASLFRLYAKEKQIPTFRETVLTHEMKHIKNNIMLSGLLLKRNAKRLTVEDMYRLEVEDERSAYLSEKIYAINKYLKNNNLNDFSMFNSHSQELVNELKGLPENQRAARVMDIPRIVNEELERFARDNRAYYDGNQFGRNLSGVIESHASAILPEDIAHEEYKRLQALYYHFDVYNPTTGKMESRNLSQYIKAENQVEISEDINNSIIKPNKQEMQNKINTYLQQERNGKIDHQLLEEARALQRSMSLQPRFVNNVDGFELSRLYDEENTPNGTEQQPIPDDKADWSDDLQKYWSKVDGYQEVAKNNLEYRFKVNEDTISYTAKNKANVSKEAKYETYVKLLNEPTNKDLPVTFKDTLSPEQAVRLYVACINNGRKPIGNVPQNMDALQNVHDIPAAELQKFRSLQSQSHNATVNRQTFNGNRTRVGRGGRC